MTSGAADREGGRGRGFVRTAVAVFATGLFDATVAFGASFLVLGAMIVLWGFGPFWAGQMPGENGGPGFGLVLGGVLVGTFALPVAPWVVGCAFAANALRVAVRPNHQGFLRLGLALVAAGLLVGGVTYEIFVFQADPALEDASTSTGPLPFGWGLVSGLGFMAASPLLGFLGRDLLMGWWAIARRRGERLPVTETSSGSP